MGGQVTVVNDGGIQTSGMLSYGIIAQSVGGGGGNGGFAVGGAFSDSGETKSTVGGGGAGGGGKGGVVEVDNTGMIIINKMGSVGILAQSIGGGGGTGGFAAGAAFGSGDKVSSTVGGGSGGSASDGGQVTVNNSKTGLIQTFQDNSTGILAQSIGGGGGNGAFSLSAAGGSGDGLNQSVGGSGGMGGKGGLVTVTNAGQIQTDGALSYGIYAQSIGGGGGKGGFSVAGTFTSGAGLTTTVGGTGGNGGVGGDVVVNNTGTIMVNGAGSVGVFAQSVGGGGGAAGFAGGLGLSAVGTLKSTVGGAGGGGNGGNVTVTSTGSIETKGADSVAVIAQSIGGGGGSNAFSIGVQTGALDGAFLQIGASGTGAQGTNGNVVVNISGGMTMTNGDLSYGLLSQAIGGGGGNAALSVPDPLTVGVGGVVQALGATGSVDGNGNPLNVQYSNNTQTVGAGAIGYVAQTIGGGGGTSGVTGDVAFTAPGPVTVSLGGSTTGGGSGGAGSLTNTASISTGGGSAVASGDAAAGLVAQSIGGGGGTGIFAAGVVTGTAGPVLLALGGSEGGLDNGGALSVTSSGTIST